MLTAGVAKRFQHLRGLVFSPRLRAAVVTMDTDMGASLRDLVRTRSQLQPFRKFNVRVFRSKKRLLAVYLEAEEYVQ